VSPSVGIASVYVNGVRTYAEGGAVLASAGRMLKRRAARA